MSTTFGRTDKIDIFNLVSTLLSAEAITDAEFATPTLKITKAIIAVFRIARNSLLTEHNWKFARVITELIDAPTEVTLLGWDYVYYYPNYDNLPTSGNKPQGSVFLRKIFVDTESQDPEALDYKLFNYFNSSEAIDGIFIATQCDDCFAEYTNFGFDDDAGSTYSGTNSLHYDPVFSEALAFKVASMICKKITGDLKLTADLVNRYEERLSKARLHDQNQEKIADVKLKTCDFLDAR